MRKKKAKERLNFRCRICNAGLPKWRSAYCSDPCRKKGERRIWRQHHGVDGRRTGPWTMDEVHRLRALRRDGHTIDECAEQLQRRWGSVHGYIYRHDVVKMEGSKAPPVRGAARFYNPRDMRFGK
jgi:hypothetical protein